MITKIVVFIFTCIMIELFIEVLRFGVASFVKNAWQDPTMYVRPAFDGTADLILCLLESLNVALLLYLGYSIWFIIFVAASLDFLARQVVQRIWV